MEPEEGETMRRNRSPRPWLTTMFLAAAAVLVGVLPVGAQSTGYRVAVLTPGVTYAPALEGLRESLSRLGYQEGKNISFIVDDTKAGVSGLAGRAKKLVEAKPDVLVTVTTPHTTAAKQATTTIPIVFVWVGDPLRSGLIASYASSKNNLTGVAAYSGPLSAKRLEILKEIVPGIKRVLAVVTTNDSIAESSFQSVSETAKRLGVQVVRKDVTTKEEIEKVILETAKGSVEAIYAAPSALVGVHIGLLIKKSKENRLPLVAWENSMVEQGALFAYGGDIRQVGVQSAKLVSKVLRGAKPSDVPTEIPEKLMLVINLSTARAIGLKIPDSVLERADRRIE